MTGQYSFGWRPDQPDSRDHVFSALRFRAPPEAASVRVAENVVRDQGSTGTCVGFGTTSATRAAYVLGNQQCPLLSPLFTYAMARWVAKELPLEDNGTTIRDAIKSLVNFGAASETAWKFARGAVNELPHWSAKRDAYDRRGVRGYERIGAGDVTGVKLAIAARKPVVAGWTLDSEFMRYSGGVLGPCTGAPVGGHCMLIESYDGDVFTILNSWGSGWGEGGRARVTSGFIARGVDLWAITV